MGSDGVSLRSDTVPRGSDEVLLGSDGVSRKSAKVPRRAVKNRAERLFSRKKM